MNSNSLLNVRYIKNLLKANRLMLSRRRGQHFLVDGNILEKILRVADLQPEDQILEIGPGLGTMTRELCRRAGRVVAVEWDRGLVRLLLEETADCNNLQVIRQDILKMDLNVLPPLFNLDSISKGAFKVVSNLPYSVASPILVKLLESTIELNSMICMVQEEVGERLVSLPGQKSYGRLTVLAQMYSKPRIAFKVKRSCFFPSPRVDSVIVHFQMLSGGAYPVKNVVYWKALVKAAFTWRRKMLKNTIARDPRLPYASGQILEACSRVDIDPCARAEQLSVGDFARLADSLLEIADN